MHKILIVDDDENIIMTLQSILEVNGYTVVTAGNGEEALAKIRAEVPDLMVLDLNMPNMDGASVAYELKMKATLKPIPILIVSGLVAGDISAQFPYDNVSFMSKPFEVEQLLARIEKMLPSA